MKNIPIRKILKQAVGWLAALILIAGIVLLIIYAPEWILYLDLQGHSPTEGDPLLRLNDYRKTIVQIVGGIVVGIGLYINWKRVVATQKSVELTEQTLRLTESGQMTDRFSKAIEQLGDKDNLSVRLGGIYALERIAKDSEKDHPTIMEVLTTFVKTRPTEHPTDDENSPPPNMAVDTQAAMTVLGRRNTDFDRGILDLGGANLLRADLHRANLQKAYLQEANLKEAFLLGANLQGASLWRANLHRANLLEAFLKGANLRKPTFGKPSFRKPTLRKPSFRKPTLRKPSFSTPTFSTPTFSSPTFRKPTLRKPTLREQLLLDLKEIHFP